MGCASRTSRDQNRWISSHATCADVWTSNQGLTSLFSLTAHLDTAFRRALLSFPAEQRGNGAAEGVGESPGAPKLRERPVQPRKSW
ncbi:hypothetical protein AOLI_G00068190 [Acnodon oligacanthus]